MARGGSRPGAGRKRGAITKRTRQVAEAALELRPPLVQPRQGLLVAELHPPQAALGLQHAEES